MRVDSDSDGSSTNAKAKLKPKWSNRTKSRLLWAMHSCMAYIIFHLIGDLIDCWAFDFILILFCQEILRFCYISEAHMHTGGVQKYLCLFVLHWIDLIWFLLLKIKIPEIYRQCFMSKRKVSQFARCAHFSPLYF